MPRRPLSSAYLQTEIEKQEDHLAHLKRQLVTAKEYETNLANPRRAPDRDAVHGLGPGEEDPDKVIPLVPEAHERAPPKKERPWKKYLPPQYCLSNNRREWLPAYYRQYDQVCTGGTVHPIYMRPDGWYNDTQERVQHRIKFFDDSAEPVLGPFWSDASGSAKTSPKAKKQVTVNVTVTGSKRKSSSKRYEDEADPDTLDLGSEDGKPHRRRRKNTHKVHVAIVEHGESDGEDGEEEEEKEDDA